MAGRALCQLRRFRRILSPERPPIHLSQVGDDLGPVVIDGRDLRDAPVFGVTLDDPDLAGTSRLEEILAEALAKVRSARALGDDIPSDAWFLLQQDVPVDKVLFERKLSLLGESARVSVTTTVREYDRELSVLLEYLPDYAEVLETVLNAVGAASLLVETP